MERHSVRRIADVVAVGRAREREQQHAAEVDRDPDGEHRPKRRGLEQDPEQEQRPDRRPRVLGCRCLLRVRVLVRDVSAFFLRSDDSCCVCLLETRTER